MLFVQLNVCRISALRFYSDLWVSASMSFFFWEDQPLGNWTQRTVNSPSSAAALSSLVVMGSWWASTLAWNEYLVLERSVASVLQAFLLKNFGEKSWWPDHSRKEMILRPVAPCRHQGRNPADHHFITFCCLLFCSNFSFFSCLLYGWKLPSLGQHDTGEAAYDRVMTVRWDSFVCSDH